MQSEDTCSDIGTGIGACLTYLMGICGATLGSDIVIVIAAVHNSRWVKNRAIAVYIPSEIVGWEVVVEQDADEAPEPSRKFTVQLPPDQTSVLVPAEYLEMFLGEGFDEFKFEVGAIEESGNQTFSEGTFTVAE